MSDDPKQMQERLDEVGDDIETARRDIEARNPQVGERDITPLYGDDDPDADIDEIRGDLSDPGTSTA